VGAWLYDFSREEIVQELLGTVWGSDKRDERES
jgi:hypothetical protein